MKTVTFISVGMFLMVVNVKSEYRALSRGDRADFLQTYEAIKIAMAEKNYRAIIRFTPDLIIRYESIMLDPSCAMIRPQFLEMNEILRDARNIRAADSLEEIITSTQRTGDIREQLRTYDTILLSLAALDTLRYRSHLMYYNGLAVSIANSKTMDTYSFLSSLKFIDTSILENYRITVKDKFDVRIAQLSAAMNPDSIVAFQAMYPGVHKDDIAALLDRSRLSMRHSLLRRPSMQAYREYKRIFGDDPALKEVLSKQAFEEALGTIPDPAPIKEYVTLFPEDGPRMWNQYEDSLFAKWSSRRTSVNTQAYMRLYPQGRYAAIIQDHFQSIQSLSTYSPGYFDQVGP